ncbi:DUF3347 domain-containing protein [Pedobacter sp. AW31-3R]|uniref:DUF3347 domain-containing protein n=1 Tax=Pedobacter sp. AW31-3R TaxID=3445781 RepID=UPI003F9F87C3
MKKYIGIAVLSTFIACTNSQQQQSAETDTTSTKTAAATTPVELADPEIENIYNGYISLKNALVNSNPAASKTAAAALVKSLNSHEGCENTALIAEKIAGTDDLKSQRKDFTALSSDVIALFKHADLKAGKIYVQHCPMANNGDGGDWLSSEAKIRNPYYGDEMMECGNVLEEIQTAAVK